MYSYLYNTCADIIYFFVFAGMDFGTLREHHSED